LRWLWKLLAERAVTSNCSTNGALIWARGRRREAGAMMLNSDTCKTARLEGADRAPLCPLWRLDVETSYSWSTAPVEVRPRVPRLGNRVETQTRPIEWTLCTQRTVDME
jgi:hypothetical protein